MAGLAAFSALTGAAGFAGAFKGVLGLGLADVLTATFTAALATGFAAGLAFVTGLGGVLDAAFLTG